MPTLPPALADRALRMRNRGQRIKDIAAQLGVSVYAIKMATTPGFAARQKAHHRRVDAARAESRKADPAYRSYKAAYYRLTRGLTPQHAVDLGDTLIERRRQRGLEQRDAADAFGVTLTTYQTWEAARCPRSQIKLVTLALRGLDGSATGARQSSAGSDGQEADYCMSR